MPASPDRALIERVRAELQAAGDPVRAAGAQRYLKSALPLHGLRTDDMRRLVRGIYQDCPIGDRGTWEATIRALWNEATHREQRYAAIELAAHRRYRAWQDSDIMPLYEHLIVTGAWWDLVDQIATRLVAVVLAAYPQVESARMRQWSTGEDLWLRRVAIICQLPFKGSTDLELLTAAIDANVEGTAFGSQFFVRKAIGWALRSYAYTDPDWVRAFVAAREDQLSGLSKREARKHLG